MNLQASKIVSHDIESAALAKNIVGISSTRHIEVYLPDGYGDGKNRYPVIYYIGHHYDIANAAFYSSAFDEAIKTGKTTPAICVFIDVHEGTLFLNSLVTGNWEDFIVSELVPFIDKTYQTIPDRKARGIMGHSIGGYSAFILPVLHPDVWGAIGGNDPCTWVMWYPLIDEKDSAVPLTIDFADIRRAYENLPKDLKNYNSSIIMDLGTRFSPDVNSPILCDVPLTPEGNWVPEIRAKWSAYNLVDPNTLPKYIGTLKSFSSITIAVPEVMDLWNTASVPNIYFIDVLKAAGVNITRLDMPGDHGAFMPERFATLAEQLLIAMQGSGVMSVSSRGKLVATWGDIKSKD